MKSLLHLDCAQGAFRLWIFCLAGALPVLASEPGRIRPYENNPFYWQYQGNPVLLLGGSWQDNLFNHPTGLEQHLDRLTSAGGNYVRNVMSHRNRGNVFAYGEVDGKFDLDQWNPEYWQRFDHFLELTHEREIIVQIEVWATWDHYEDHQTLGGWSKHPFNPINNVNYSGEQSGLPTAVNYAPAARPTGHTFFHTVPALQNNAVVLPYQQAFVDKLLSYSLNYPHVLYCMNNETGEPVEWSDYWAGYIRQKAMQAGQEIETAEMRRNSNIITADHQHMINHPGLYTFLDISQNNTQAGQTHWDRFQQFRALLKESPRPINNNKIYTFSSDPNVALERWWRNIFGGCASARFHRPHPLEGVEDHEKMTTVGLGLSFLAQTHIRSGRMLSEAMNLFSGQPRNDLLSERSPNEAYCFAEPGREYAVYFPRGGAVELDLSTAQGVSPLWTVRWLDISQSAWSNSERLKAGENLKLEAPGADHWVALVLPEEGSPDFIPPLIATPPQNQGVTLGQSVTLTVELDEFSTPPFTYQWRFDGQDILGATEAVYTIPSFQSDQGGLYSVVVSNVAGTVTSPSAVVFQQGAIPSGGLVLHLDAATLGLEDGAPVSLWPDLSGSGNHAVQDDERRRPAFVASGSPSGLPVVRFRGTFPFPHLLVQGIGPHHPPNTIFLVWKINESTGGDQNALDGLTEATRVRLGYQANAGRLFAHSGGSFPNLQKLMPVPFDHPMMATVVYDTAGGSLRLDGVLEHQNATGEIPITGFIIGRRTTTEAQHLVGDIAELLVYHGRLSETELEQVELYLADKWLKEEGMDPMPPPLTLNAKISDGQLLLSWPASARGFTIQETASLMPPINWSPVPAKIVEQNGHHTARIQMTAGSRFLQLAR